MAPSGYPVKIPPRSELKELVISGASRSELEERYAVRWTTILRWMRKLNIRRPLKDKFSASRMKRLYLNERKTLQEIADLAGMTAGGVAYRLRCAGVVLRSPKDRLTTADKDAPFIKAGLSPVEAFKHNNAPRLCRCNTCGQHVAPSRSNLHKGQGGCKYCAKRAVTASDVDDLFTTAMLEPLEPYISSASPRLCRCLVCGGIVTPRQNDLRQGQGGCRFCAANTPIEVSPDDLRRLYELENLSTCDIAERLGCSSTTVLKYLNDYKISILPRHRKYGAEKPTVEQLREWYLFDRRSSVEIAALCGTTTKTVMRWVRESDIPIFDGGNRTGFYYERAFLNNPSLYWSDGLLYLVRFSVSPTEQFLKVGIGLKYSRRLRNHRISGAEVIQVRYGPIYDCFVIEQKILRDFSAYRYYPNRAVLPSGSSECFEPNAPIDLDGYELKVICN